MTFSLLNFLCSILTVRPIISCIVLYLQSPRPFNNLSEGMLKEIVKDKGRGQPVQPHPTPKESVYNLTQDIQHFFSITVCPFQLKVHPLDMSSVWAFRNYPFIGRVLSLQHSPHMSTKKWGLSYIFWLQKRGSIRQSIPAHLFNGSAPPPPGKVQVVVVETPVPDQRVSTNVCG